MARITPRSPVNGRPAPRKSVSHEKPEPDDEVDDAVEVTADDEVPAGRPPVDSLSEMLASLQGATSSRITVYRVVKNQPQSYVFECDPASFSLDDLRDKYNGGEFRLYVSKDGRLFKNMRVVVEPKQMPHVDHMPNATGMADVLAVMRDGFAAQAAALRDALAAAQARPVSSPFSGMDIPAIITAISGAVAALRPPTPATPDTSKAIDMFMQGLQLARELRDDAAPADNSIGGMLRDVLKSPIVAAAVQTAVQPQVPPQPARLPNPAAATPQPAPVSHAKPAAPQPTPQPENQVLSYYLGFLVGKAKIGSDPSLYAELVLDNIPDEQLTPMLQRGDALIDDLVAIHAPVAEHREWFFKLLAEINALLEPGDEGGEVEQPGATNAVDATTIVVPGQPAA